MSHGFLSPSFRVRFLPVAAPALLAWLLFSFVAGTAQADWVQTSGPRGGYVRSLVTVPNGAGGTSLYSGQIFVWRTDDNGGSWSRLSNGLTDPNAFSLIAVPNGSGGHDLLAGTNGGIFRSTDNGASWAAINSGITNLSIYALASGPNGSGGTNLYAGAFMGNAYRSTNNGASWTAINNGLPLGYNLNALTTTTAGTVLAGSSNGIYRSTNFGASWTRVFTLYALAFARHGTALYAGTGNGVYRSTDDGASWTPINNGMAFNWTYAVAAIPNGPGVTLFAGAGYVSRSTDNGATWTIVNNGMTSPSVYALTTAPNAQGGTDLYAGTAEGIFRSSDHGNSWTNVSVIFSSVRALEVTPSGRVLAATENDIFRSDDAGASWIDTQAGTTVFGLAVNPNGTSGVSLFAGSSPSGVCKSTNDGATWTDANFGVDDLDVNSVGVVPNGAGGTNILAGTYSELFISTNDGGHWQPANLQTLTLDYAVTPNGSGGHNIFAAGFGGVWLSTNGGTAWTPRYAGLEDKIVLGIAATANGANLFAGGDPFGVYRSTDNGITWSLVNNGLTDLRITSLLSPDGSHLFAGGAGGIFLSSDHGNSWTSVGTGLTAGVNTLALSVDGATLLAGSGTFGVWKRPLAEMIQVLAVGDDEPLPIAMALHANRPNPFRTGTTIEYALPQSAPVRLVVFDIAGRPVRTLVEEMQSAGDRRVTWDGRDERGALARPGIYLYRLDAAGVTLTRKMTLLR